MKCSSRAMVRMGLFLPVGAAEALASIKAENGSDEKAEPRPVMGWRSGDSTVGWGLGSVEGGIGRCGLKIGHMNKKYAKIKE